MNQGCLQNVLPRKQWELYVSSFVVSNIGCVTGKTEATSARALLSEQHFKVGYSSKSRNIFYNIGMQRKMNK